MAKKQTNCDIQAKRMLSKRMNFHKSSYLSTKIQTSPIHLVIQPLTKIKILFENIKATASHFHKQFLLVSSDFLFMVLTLSLLCARGPFYSMVKVVKHLIGPKYNGKKLRNLMAKTFGLARISDTLTDVVIPTFDIKLLQPAIFSTSEVIYHHSIGIADHMSNVIFSCFRISQWQLKFLLKFGHVK